MGRGRRGWRGGGGRAAASGVGGGGADYGQRTSTSEDPEPVELLRETIHPWLGYVVAAVVLVVTLLAFSWAKDSREFNRTPFSVAVGLIDLQVLLGLVVYVASQAWNFGPLIAQVHPLIAVLAAVAAHVGVSRARAERMVADAHRKAGRALILALVLILAAIAVATVG